MGSGQLVRQLFRIVAFALWATCLAGRAAATEGILLSEADRTIYIAAFEEVDAKRFETARNLTEQAVNTLPGKVIYWLDLTRDETTADFAQLASFINKNPDWPRQRKLLRNAERVMPADMPDARLLAWFEGRHAKVPPILFTAKKPNRIALDDYRRYAADVQRTADRFGIVVPSEPVDDDDSFDAKIELLLSEPVPLVSFTATCVSISRTSKFHYD